jgi:hypothetical protein
MKTKKEKYGYLIENDNMYGFKVFDVEKDDIEIFTKICKYNIPNIINPIDFDFLENKLIYKIKLLNISLKNYCKMTHVHNEEKLLIIYKMLKSIELLDLDGLNIKYKDICMDTKYNPYLVNITIGNNFFCLAEIIFQMFSSFKYSIEYINEEEIKLSDKNTSNIIKIHEIKKFILSEYKDIVFDLIHSILDKNSIKDILDHSIFSFFKNKINYQDITFYSKKLEIPKISYKEMIRNHIKMIINILNDNYSELNAEILFLACDLFFKSYSFLLCENDEELDKLSYGCLYLAFNILKKKYSLYNYISKYQSLYATYKNDMIHYSDIIIKSLKGIVNENRLYHLSEKAIDLLNLNSIIILDRSLNYLYLTDDAIIKIMKENREEGTKMSKKDVKIKDLFE